MMDTKQMTRTALLTALICVLSPLSIPLTTMVPISLATLAVMLAGAVLGAKHGALAAALYLVIGALGVPVFAGYSAGAQELFGVTGGYLFGYIVLAFFTGWFAHRYEPGRKGMLAGMLIGTAALYLIGTVWFMVLTKMPLAAALSACVIPFLPGDCLKMAVVLLIAPRLSRAIGSTR